MTMTAYDLKVLITVQFRIPLVPGIQTMVTFFSRALAPLNLARPLVALLHQA
jgi:hypothetical protein